MKILIINTVSRDKSLLATPVVRLLKTTLNAKVHVLANADGIALLENNPNVDKIQLNEGSVFTIRKTLKKEQFDWIIDLQNNLRSKRIRFQLSRKFVAFKKHTLLRWLFVKTKINKLPKAHRVDQYLDMLKPIGIVNDDLGLEFFIPEKDEVENEWLPKTHQNGYVAIAISASHNTKKLPVNRLIELCDRINKPIVLVGETEDRIVSDEVAQFFKQGTTEEEEAIEQLNKKAIIFNACGKFNFNQSASLLKNANWIFTYDNVAMHIASAFEKQIFTMWGNTTPHFGTYPYRTQFTVFENNKLSCRPCALSGFNNCPKGHFKCMNDMTFDFYLPD